MDNKFVDERLAKTTYLKDGDTFTPVVLAAVVKANFLTYMASPPEGKQFEVVDGEVVLVTA